MIRKATLIFCDNEHGMGDITFPEINDLVEDFQNFIEQRSAKQLRKDAKIAGWAILKKGDYCPACKADVTGEPE